MRPVLTREEAEQLIERIPSIRAEVFETYVLRELVEHYEASLKTHDCADLIALTMSLYAKKQGMEQQKKKFGGSGRAVYETGGGTAVWRAFGFLGDS